MVSYGLGGPTLCIYIYVYLDSWWVPQLVSWKGGYPQIINLNNKPCILGYPILKKKKHITKQMQLSYQKSAIDSNS